MSFRDCRNFCEIMRGLGYSRLISMENFKKPNFELVADILYWLALRYDPSADIPDDIDDERSRVEFIKTVVGIFQTRAKIKLNPKKIYQADTQAVQEILKVASILYKAYTATANEQDENIKFQLPSKLGNIKAHKQLAQEITELGVKLFDLLGKEPDLKSHRDRALSFLDNISRNLESNNEQQYIEKCVRDIIAQQDVNIDEMQKYVTSLERDQRSLEEKIRKVTHDVERQEERLRMIVRMKPTHMEEYERLESELEKWYNLYVQKYRNLDYLENELDIYIKEEQKKMEIESKRIEAQSKNYRDDIERQINDVDGDEMVGNKDHSSAGVNQKDGSMQEGEGGEDSEIELGEESENEGEQELENDSADDF